MRVYALLLSLAAACGSGACSDPEPYDTSCTQDQDCVAVEAGECGGCRCTFAAINVKDAERYDEDRRDQCDDGPVCGLACESQKAVCSSGRCELE